MTRIVRPVSSFTSDNIAGEWNITVLLQGVRLRFPTGKAEQPRPTKVKLVLEYESPSDAQSGNP